MTSYEDWRHLTPPMARLNSFGSFCANLPARLVSEHRRCRRDHDEEGKMPDPTEALVAAIVSSVEGMGDPQGGERVAAYALIVDPGLQSVFGASASQAFLDDQGDECLLFMPVDWAVEHHSAAFEQASEQLVRTLQSMPDPSYDDRVRFMAECLISALGEAKSKKKGRLGRALMIVVCAGGGSGVWRSVEEASVRRLNDASAYEKWALEFG